MSTPEPTLECGACCLLIFLKRDCIKHESWQEQSSKAFALSSTSAVTEHVERQSVPRSSCGGTSFEPLRFWPRFSRTFGPQDRKEIDKMRASLRLIVTLSLLVIGAPH